MFNAALRCGNHQCFEFILYSELLLQFLAFTAVPRPGLIIFFFFCNLILSWKSTGSIGCIQSEILRGECAVTLCGVNCLRVSIYFFVSPFVGMIQYDSPSNFAFPFWLVPTLIISRSWIPYNMLIFCSFILKIASNEKKKEKFFFLVV